MVSVFVTMAYGLDVLPRLLIEGFLAARCAEVVSLTLIIRFASGSLGVNVHVTNGVFYHVFSPLLKTGFAFMLQFTPKRYRQTAPSVVFLCRQFCSFGGKLTREKQKMSNGS
jgi:hypothetical protein